MNIFTILSSFFIILISICIYNYDKLPLSNNIILNNLSLPIINIKCKNSSSQIYNAFINYGFVIIRNHNISSYIFDELENIATQFFKQDELKKNLISIENKPISSWRGYFPLGYELTAGIKDLKEGIYFGVEHDINNPFYLNNTPTFGQNKWNSMKMKEIVLEYINQVNYVAENILEKIAFELTNDHEYFKKRFKNQEPIKLFRIFNYPIINSNEFLKNWGVGEHTDYGFLTILWFNGVDGLQVRSRFGNWINVKLLKKYDLVVNIGDILEMWTNGLFRATPHRVLPNYNGKKDRLSFPFFYDPPYLSSLKPIHEIKSNLLKDVNNYETYKRWDNRLGKDLLQIGYSNKIYGHYLWSKLKNVFPKLAKKI